MKFVHYKSVKYITILFEISYVLGKDYHNLKDIALLVLLMEGGEQMYFLQH
jgi:hypothetical protein